MIKRAPCLAAKLGTPGEPGEAAEPLGKSVPQFLVQEHQLCYLELLNDLFSDTGHPLLAVCSVFLDPPAKHSVGREPSGQGACAIENRRPPSQPPAVSEWSQYAEISAGTAAFAVHANPDARWGGMIWGKKDRKPDLGWCCDRWRMRRKALRYAGLIRRGLLPVGVHCRGWLTAQNSSFLPSLIRHQPLGIFLLF